MRPHAHSLLTKASHTPSYLFPAIHAAHPPLCPPPAHLATQ
ncbi:hypothetical protein E2C01_058377 [Portunus trituberculatus]|uniref:Uncharacterized protein n=1 Tax=Portunus trituberculatus TaxID=210409 RepID=A0A5B7H3K3_PORTR|nr:hypothetical protein [Portunus trituberculatus]